MNKTTLLRTTFMVAVLLMVAVGSTGAKFKPTIKVNLLWRPDLQFDTIDTNGSGTEDEVGDDFRYADVDIWVTSNTPFFAVDLTCTVNRLVLDGYEWDDPTVSDAYDTPQGGDDTPMVVWGDQWGEMDNDFGVVDGTVNSYNPLKGTFHLAATELGWRNPLGGNGYNETLLVATMRFKVLPQTLRPGRPTASRVSCKGNFVDRDGITVTKAKFNKAGSLVVREGYVLQGSTQLQGQKTAANISVVCDNGGTPIRTVTDKSGNWTIGNIRDLGMYDCKYYANVLDADPLVQSNEPWLAAFSYSIPLWNNSYSLLPVTLFAGNTDRTGLPGDPASEIEDVEWDDFLKVTTTYGIPQPSPYAGGDANGDKKVNERDLALVGGRYYENEYTTAVHLLYDLPVDWASDWNSHIRYGAVNESASTLMSDARYKDYWATMSPNGSKIAFIRYDSKADRYRLYTGTYAKGKLRAKVLTPKTFKGDAMAPSWSLDGTQIAFHCSPDIWYDNNDEMRRSQWTEDDGRLCIINANGTGFEELGGTWNARVYPPTWFNNHVIIFGANNRHSACADSICYYDLDRDHTDPVNALLDFTSGDDVADMPVVRDDGTGKMHLFYRFIDRQISGSDPEDVTINSRTIHYVRSLTYDGEVFSIGPEPAGTDPDTRDVPITFYEDFSDTEIFTMGDVEYYNVDRRAEGMSIIGYGHESYNNDQWYGWDFFISWYKSGPDVWDDTSWRSTDRQNGFESVDWRGWYKCGHQPNDPYNPQCQSFGLRNTAEILP